MTPRNPIFTKSDSRHKILVSGSAPPRPNYMESSEYSFSVKKKKWTYRRFCENGAIGVLHHRVQINIEILGILGMFLDAVGGVRGVI